MANQYINNMTDLWNSAGTTYTSIKMNVTNAASAVDSKLFQLLVGTVNRFSVDKVGNLVAAGSLTSSGLISSGVMVPSANDSAALGASGTAWSDLFLASGGVINWNAGDVTATHATDQLIFAGAASGYSFSHVVQPTANDGAALGTAALSWSDLYLATGAAINCGNGNWVATHSDGMVTVSTGDLRVATAGTNDASAVTVGGTQTLTNKTLTSPTINTAAIVTPAITGTPTAGGATWANLGAVTTCDINGGTIDATQIGATTPSTIAATTITATSSSVSTLTASTSVTAPTGTFSSSVYGGSVNTGQVVQSTATNIIVSPAAGNNTIYLRPRGYSNATGQVYIDNTGQLVAGALYTNQNLQSAGALVLGANSSGVYLRPYGVGNDTNQFYFSTEGGARTGFFHTNQTGVATYAFYAPGPSGGSANHTAYFTCNSSPNCCASFHYLSNGTSYAFLAFHQPNVQWWAGYFVGPVVSTVGFQTSDRRSKHDITDCDCHEAYHKVRKISVKAYNKQGMTRRRDGVLNEIGWMAQDIEPFIPEAVIDVPVALPDVDGKTQEPKETRKATNDRTMLAILWAAVQHQADLIEQIEARLEKK